MAEEVLNKEELQAAVTQAERVAASINSNGDARSALAKAIKEDNRDAVAELLRAHGLRDASSDRLTFGGMPVHPELVCLEWRYFLSPKLTWHGIDWDVNEWCAAWAHA